MHVKLSLSGRVSPCSGAFKLHYTVRLKSNDDGDGDGNEKGKKAIGLDWHNSNFVL